MLQYFAMPKKTREQKIRAAARRNTDIITHTDNNEKSIVRNRKKVEIVNETDNDKVQRKYFMMDFKKSIFITFIILAFEIAAKYLHLDTIIRSYLKI